jgi:hypothetical protein
MAFYDQNGNAQVGYTQGLQPLVSLSAVSATGPGDRPSRVTLLLFQAIPQSIPQHTNNQPIKAVLDKHETYGLTCVFVGCRQSQTAADNASNQFKTRTV